VSIQQCRLQQQRQKMPSQTHTHTQTRTFTHTHTCSGMDCKSDTDCLGGGTCDIKYSRIPTSRLYFAHPLAGSPIGVYIEYMFILNVCLYLMYVYIQCMFIFNVLNPKIPTSQITVLLRSLSELIHELWRRTYILRVPNSLMKMNIFPHNIAALALNCTYTHAHVHMHTGTAIKHVHRQTHG